MKIKGIDGEYAFKALINNGYGWKLTSEYYFTNIEALHFNEGKEVIWPVEQLDNSLYVPNQEELRGTDE